MAIPKTSLKTTNILSIAIFIFVFIAMAYYGHIWPGILLATWTALACRQYLCGRIFELFLSTFVFGGLFLTFVLIINWNTVLPFFFTIVSVGLLYREFALTEKQKHISLDNPPDPNRKNSP